MRLIVLLISVNLLFAGIVEDFLNKKYSKVCTAVNIKKNLYKPKTLTIIGVSCVKSDKLSLLPYIARRLVNTKTDRRNAIYFLTIYMQKRLVYSFIFDKFQLTPFNLPETDYILSKVFVKLREGKYHLKNGKYEINLKDEKVLLYPFKNKVILDEYKNGELIKRRRYW